MNSRMLKFLDKEIEEDFNSERDMDYTEDSPDMCRECNGTGKISISGYCENNDNIIYSHHDESCEIACKECDGSGRINLEKVPHSRLIYIDK